MENSFESNLIKNPVKKDAISITPISNPLELYTRS